MVRPWQIEARLAALESTEHPRYSEHARQQWEELFNDADNVSDLTTRAYLLSTVGRAYMRQRSYA